MKSKSDILLLILGIIFLCGFLISGFFLGRYYLRYRAELKSDDEIAGLRAQDLEKEEAALNSQNENADTANAEALANQSALLSVNADYVAYLTIPDVIEYPVVQGKNDYYLTHDFYQEKNSHGAIFLDESCAVTDDILLIHGHHMKDGTMFAGLKNYKKEDFRKENPTMELDFGSGNETYQLFAVADIDLTTDDYFHYEKFPANDEERKTYLKKLEESAIYYSDFAELLKDKQLVILSTCDYETDDERLIVVFYKE